MLVHEALSFTITSMAFTSLRNAYGKLAVRTPQDEHCPNLEMLIAVRGGATCSSVSLSTVGYITAAAA